jgi:hypothetical protein
VLVGGHGSTDRAVDRLGQTVDFPAYRAVTQMAARRFSSARSATHDCPKTITSTRAGATTRCRRADSPTSAGQPSKLRQSKYLNSCGAGHRKVSGDSANDGFKSFQCAAWLIAGIGPCTCQKGQLRSPVWSGIFRPADYFLRLAVVDRTTSRSTRLNRLIATELKKSSNSGLAPRTTQS